jgi:hypothetical protein
MGYYLFDHPPRRSQGAPRTTWGFPSAPSGVVAVHDTEGVMDNQGDDWGAENTAAYIVTRSDPGSYHEIHDGDSLVVMAPDDWMTWNVAADQANGHNWGISAACRTVDWNPDTPWTQRVIASMGRSIAAFWERNGIDVARANRWITRAEANARIPGLILHGTWQPGDRSDAWATHPRRGELDQMLVDAISAAAGGTAPPAGDDEMSAEQEARIIQRIDDAGAATRDFVSARLEQVAAADRAIMGALAQGIVEAIVRADADNATEEQVTQKRDELLAVIKPQLDKIAEDAANAAADPAA